jgi:hypothetical protein
VTLIFTDTIHADIELTEKSKYDHPAATGIVRQDLTAVES